VFGRIYSDDNGRAETDARIITASCRRCIPDDAADAVPLLVHDAAVTLVSGRAHPSPPLATRLLRSALSITRFELL